MVDDLKDTLKSLNIPEPSGEAKSSAMQMAMQAFEKEQKEKFQGMHATIRPIHKENKTSWIRSFNMKKAYAFAGSFTAVAVVLAVTTTHYSDILKEVNPQPQQVDMVAPTSTPEAKKDIAAPEAQPVAEAAKEQHEADASYSAAPQVDYNAPGMAAGAVAPVAPPATTSQLRRDNAPLMKMEAKRLRPVAEENTASMAAPGMSADMMYGGVAVMPQPMPPEYRGGDRFEHKAANVAKNTANEPVSTFSIDVDTASYAFVRRVLNQGQLPQPEMVRTEELINYFDYNYATPADTAHPFAANITVASSPWNSSKKLVHIGIKGMEKHHIKKPSANLVFLIDVSGSMNSHDKLPLLKSSLHMLVDQLDEQDRIAIVTYAGYAGTALTPTTGADKQTIRNVIDQLGAGGSTAGAAGIEQAYTLAQQHFNKDGVNRVILATDGDFNVGMSNDDQLKQYIAQKRESGISLSVLGFGQGNYNDALMQALAQNGNGNAAYIDSVNEAKKVLVDEMSSTLFTIAKDVKIQLEWNPAKVSEYRLVGYESRLLNREDFNNDKVDAGEIGEGHEVTAIYEITPIGAPGTVDPLRYGAQEKSVEMVFSDAHEGEYGFLKIRYKQPQGSESTLMTTPINAAAEVADIHQASPEARFAVAVAGFGQLLKHDAAVTGYNYDSVLQLADGARSHDPHGLRAEFVNLVRTAKNLSGGVVIPAPMPEHDQPYHGQPLPAPGVMR
ncbi:MAG: von Willebrand factor type A domain-containing protein [Alphaproteobacteria bacterium]